uniref:Recombination endonuclease VII n=1 Tax=viral metagenome TaxID=1070528 RepID=A0A6C0LUY0_9ZZZZ
MRYNAATFNTHIYNANHAVKLLEYLKSGKIAPMEGLSEKNVQKAASARDMINARSNVERPCALSCMSCHKFNAQINKSYCKGCEKNLNVERYNLKKVFGHLKTDVCDICNRKSKVIVLEHDHVTGNARSWCCNRCNTTLGLITTNPTSFIIHCSQKFNVDISGYDYPERNPFKHRSCSDKAYVFNPDGTCQ